MGCFRLGGGGRRSIESRELFMRALAAGLCMTLALGVVLTRQATNLAGDKEKPKYTIKKVMQLAHSKDGILKKVLDGEATEKEKESLAEMYAALCQCLPPRGEAAEWKKITQKAVAAAQAAVKGDAEAPALLKAATHCAVCHKQFKKLPKT
jgi:hypothetical protein